MSALPTLPRWVKDYALVALIAALVIGAFARRPSAPDLEGAAPEVHLQRTDGQDFELHAQVGRPVLLVFWAEWCGSCKQQTDDLNRLRAERPDVEILAIAVDSGDNERVALHARRHGIEYPVAAAQGDVAARYQVSALPTNVFIDAQGRVASAVVGALDFEAFDRRLR